MNCIFCNKMSKRLNGVALHILTCHKGPGGIGAKVLFYEKYYNINFNFFEQEYIKKGKGFKGICKETGIPYRALKEMSLFYKIPIRSYSEAALLSSNREEVKEKLRKAATGKPCSVITRKKHRINSLNRIITPEEAKEISEKISRAKKGKRMSEEQKKKLSLILKGKNKGQHRSEKTKQKIRLARLGKKRSPETIRKMSIALKGKNRGISRSEEVRDKIREGRRNKTYKSSYKTGYHISSKTDIKYLYRSSWELFVMQYLDKHPYIDYWEYESFRIKYTDEKGEWHFYIPDFYVKFSCGIKEIWEIKPQRMIEKFKYKLPALNAYTRRHGFNSFIITEKQLKGMREYYNQISTGVI